MVTNLQVQSKNKKVNREKMNLSLFLSGKSISLFGSAIYTFAMSVYLLRTTGSGLTFATNIILHTLPMVLLNPVAGVVADKISKKIVVVGSDLLNGIFLLTVYLLVGEIGLSIPLIYISTFVMTVLATFFNIGIESSKPNLVSKEKLVDINSLARVIESGSYFIGPLLGGLIYALFDMKFFILINGISFLVSAFLEYFIDYKYNSTKDRNTTGKNSEIVKDKIKSSIWLEMKEGYRYIFDRKHMKALVYIFIALNFFFNYSVIVPMPYLLNVVWQVDSFIFGVTQIGLPVGMIIGALLLKKVMAKVSYSRLLKRINYSTAFAVLAFGGPMLFSSSSPSQVFILFYYTALMVMSGLVISWVDIPMSVLLQQIVPEGLLGRVISVKLSIVKIIVPVSLLFSGWLLNYVSPLLLFGSGAIVFIAFSILFFGSSLGKEFVNVSNENSIEEGLSK